MNKTRYKIATLTGSAVMAAMLLSLLILNIVFNKILYLIFDYPHKHYTFKYFEV